MNRLNNEADSSGAAGTYSPNWVDQASVERIRLPFGGFSRRLPYPIVDFWIEGIQGGREMSDRVQTSARRCTNDESRCTMKRRPAAEEKEAREEEGRKSPPWDLPNKKGAFGTAQQRVLFARYLYCESNCLCYK
ncbi:hypothetical protein HPP92_016368 [Vanilla planifolia]|uniref:Uncharacterized protein n=1 Tax=Vanilla planifolia TaxID=51239 RepID=A0A835QJ69_VANPL|nr:hypothetical protein HPP92_016368 [Vanilla planifolia]